MNLCQSSAVTVMGLEVGIENTLMGRVSWGLLLPVPLIHKLPTDVCKVFLSGKETQFQPSRTLGLWLSLAAPHLFFSPACP